jgi:hypothetical protein
MRARKEGRSAATRRNRPHSPRGRGNRHEETVELMHALLEAKDVGRPIEEQLGPEPIPARHLHCQAAHVADLYLALAREETPLTAHACGTS